MAVIESSSMALKLLKLAKILYNSESYCYPRSRNSSFCSKFAKPGLPPHSSKGGGAMFWSYVDLLLCVEISSIAVVVIPTTRFSSHTPPQSSLASTILLSRWFKAIWELLWVCLGFRTILELRSWRRRRRSRLQSWASLPYKNCSSKVNIHPCCLYSSEYGFFYTCTELQRHYCRRTFLSTVFHTENCTILFLSKIWLASLIMNIYLGNFTKFLMFQF